MIIEDPDGLEKKVRDGHGPTAPPELAKSGKIILDENIDTLISSSYLSPTEERR
jgi:hypothetical protein